LVALILLGFGYYAISPLFIQIRVDEAMPLVTQTSTFTPVQTNEKMSAVVTGTTGHPASGTAMIVKADGKVYLRYENFKTINGPDIYVYLSKDLDAKEYISLGKVRATEGNINYEIPPEVNVSDYPYALTWCKAFGVLFNSAKLQ